MRGEEAALPHAVELPGGALLLVVQGVAGEKAAAQDWHDPLGAGELVLGTDRDALLPLGSESLSLTGTDR
ncbi:hypothetical protein ACFWU3_34140 [Streptomyces sp. NPDC058685]|uniref:hypothetical protein n=1 Tax=Streptomyces sp. NPDC058685 TaxID=3346598 RepID=UPI003648106C